LRQIALDSGIYAVRRLTPEQLCEAVLRKMARPLLPPRSLPTLVGGFALPPPQPSTPVLTTPAQTTEQTFPFERLPRELQSLVWQNVVDTNIPIEAARGQLAPYRTVSRSQLERQRVALQSIGRTAPPFPSVFPTGYGNYPGWVGCSDLGFDRTNCRFDPDEEWPVFSVSDTYDDVIRENYSTQSHYRLHNRNRVAWNCPCIGIELPVSAGMSLITRRLYFNPRGYFTVDDLLKILTGFLTGTFTRTEIDDIVRLTREAFERNPEGTNDIRQYFDQKFPPPWSTPVRGLFDDLLQGNLKRYEGVSGINFEGFRVGLYDTRTTKNNPILIPIWES
jgi:hypothetical protein